ncbi:hypothetical protein [uncultured Eudoraea sp.]|uniref:hypothetical protein n=1 Tax=uncultured Eudoraea sp. TaxID=1035614 RepID=UPI00260214A0|nr:hypothetical protein [uncultured Eudoraea sp.]
MKRFSLYILTFLIFIACTKETIIEGTAGADGKDGIDGKDGASITATVINLEVGSEECPNGGSIVTLFADGIQFEEIVTCNGVDGEDGQDGLNVLFTTEVTATGTIIFIGHDTNGNGELDEGEVVESFEVSNGQDGYSIVFDSYRNTIVGYENETVILIGIDYNRNGVLDVPDEVIEVLKIYDGQDGVSCWDLNGNGAADPEEDINGDGEYNGLDCQGQSTDNIVDMNGVWTTDEVIQGSAIQMTTFNSLFVPNASNGENTYFVDFLWDNRLAEDVSFIPTGNSSYKMGFTVAVLIGTDRVLEGLEFENFGTENERLYVLIRNVRITNSDPIIVYFEGYLTRN